MAVQNPFRKTKFFPSGLILSLAAAKETKGLATNRNLTINTSGQCFGHKCSRFECCSQSYSTLGPRVLP